MGHNPHWKQNLSVLKFIFKSNVIFLLFRMLHNVHKFICSDINCYLPTDLLMGEVLQFYFSLSKCTWLVCYASSVFFISKTISWKFVTLWNQGRYHYYTVFKKIKLKLYILHSIRWYNTGFCFVLFFFPAG